MQVFLCWAPTHHRFILSKLNNSRATHAFDLRPLILNCSKKFENPMIPEWSLILFVEQKTELEGYSQRKSNLKWNSSAYEKYEYGLLSSGHEYGLSTPYKKFLNRNKIFKKIK